MNSTPKSDSSWRRLPVQWLDPLADGPLVISLRKLRRAAGTPRADKGADRIF